MAVLYANPLGSRINGFYFASMDDYFKKAEKLNQDAYCNVSRFLIEFFAGDEVDELLFDAMSVTQSSLPSYFAAVDELEEHEKIHIIIGVRHVRYPLDEIVDKWHDVKTKYGVESGLFRMPERKKQNIDYDALAEELSLDYNQIKIAGKNLIYRNR